MSSPTAPTIVEGVRTAIAAYCHALDDGRTADVVALFSVDGTAALPGRDPARGHDALRSLYDGVRPTGPQRHLVVHTGVTTVSDDRAAAVSDLLFLRKGDAGWAVALVGRYEDLLQQQDGRWLFTSRTLNLQAA